MDAPLFTDKKQMPDDAALAAALGSTVKRHWDSFVAHARAAGVGVEAGWKHYAGKTGWLFVARDKRRNLVYLRPDTKCFGVSLALSEQAVTEAVAADLPDDLVAAIQAAPKYPEGRPARLTVRTAQHVAIAKQLLALKLAH